jgi:F-type H+-transporting ATPase subunit delta
MTASRRKRAARRLFRLCLVDGRLDETRVRQVARSLAGSQRRGAIEVLESLRHMVRLAGDKRRASVETATVLPEDLRGTVRANLDKAYGAGLETTFTENSALIGGMRIRVGSDVYDGSVRARLAAIAAEL